MEIEQDNAMACELEVKKLKRQKNILYITVFLLMITNISTYFWHESTRKIVCFISSNTKEIYNYLNLLIMDIYKWIMSQEVNVTNIFNNREMALGVWMLIVIIFLIFYPKTRSQFLSLLKTVFNKNFVWLYIWMLLYIGLIICMLQRIKFWELYLIKDTVVWFIFSGVISVFRAIGDADDFDYFKTLARDYFKLFIVYQFIINMYTFGFMVEFFIVPIFFILGSLIAVGKVMPEFQDEKYRPVRKLFDFVSTALGIFIIVNSIYLALKDFKSLGTIKNFKTLIYPSILSLLFIIFNYIFAVVSGYEQIFIRIRFGEKKSRLLILYTKLKIFLLCRLNLKKVKTFWSEKGLKILRVKSRADVKDIINSWK